MLQHRHLLACFALCSVSLVGGVIYGWPALRQQLLADEGSQLSETQLGVGYMVGSWSTQGFRFATGLARDRFGTRSVAAFCLLAAAGGFLGLALCDANSVAGLSVALFVTGFGSGTLLCLQPVASLFPEYEGSMLAALSGAFQASGLVFLTLTSIGERRPVFLGYSALLVLWVGLVLCLIPKGVSFSKVADAGTEDTTDSMLSERSVESGVSPGLDGVVVDNPDHDEENNRNDSATADPCVPTALQQMLSMDYGLLVVWFCTLITPLQYYIGSIGYQLEQKGDETGFYVDLYSYIYGSVALFAPVGGLIADRCGLGVAEAFATILAATSLFVLASDVSLDAHIASLLCYAFGRMFVLSSFFAHVGKHFGYRNYGTLAGLGLLASAITSLLQYPMIAAAANGHARMVNLTCGTVQSSTLIYCAWLARLEFRAKKA